jgi:tetratricopeptide (TPR) repeat protein
MEETALLEKQAVQAAMKGAWDQAIELNQKILKLEPKNTAALNRLGRAFWEKGNLASAQKSYRQVLTFDRYNTIASKSLKRLADQEKTQPKKTVVKKTTRGTIFLEEPGKTKVVKLVRLASPEVLANLDSADEVLLVPKRHAISVTDTEKTYLGTIPDDLSHRLLHFIKGGNEYEAFVKTVDRQKLEIFIQETKRAAKFLNLPSFTSPLISLGNLSPR